METHAIQSIVKRLFCVALAIALSQWTSQPASLLLSTKNFWKP